MDKPLNKIYEYIEDPAIYKIYDIKKRLADNLDKRKSQRERCCRNSKKLKRESVTHVTQRMW